MRGWWGGNSAASIPPRRGTKATSGEVEQVLVGPREPSLLTGELGDGPRSRIPAPPTRAVRRAPRAGVRAGGVVPGVRASDAARRRTRRTIFPSDPTPATNHEPDEGAAADEEGGAADELMLKGRGGRGEQRILNITVQSITRIRIIFLVSSCMCSIVRWEPPICRPFKTHHLHRFFFETFRLSKRKDAGEKRSSRFDVRSAARCGG